MMWSLIAAREAHQRL